MITSLIQRIGALGTALMMSLVSSVAVFSISAILVPRLDMDTPLDGIGVFTLTMIGVTAVLFIPLMYKIEKLDDNRARLKELHIRDELTQAYTRKHFYDIARQEFERADRYHNPLSFVEIDIDDMKRINEQFGYAAGDKVLHAFAQMCHSMSRETDSFYRLGNDEFIFLLTHTDQQGAKEFVLRLQAKAKELSIEHEGHQINITVSIGYKTYTQQSCELQDVIKAADFALYTAKRNGKNLAIAA